MGIVLSKMDHAPCLVAFCGCVVAIRPPNQPKIDILTGQPGDGESAQIPKY